MPDRATIDDVVRFHGHLCPGLLIGYRAALAALDLLGVGRAADEGLVCIAETEACGLDAVQVLTGCTMGKGNLILRDWGKQVFTFARRSDGRTPPGLSPGGRLVRLALRYDATHAPADANLPDAERRRRKIDQLRTLPVEELFDVRRVDAPLPELARVFRTVRCAACGEGVMEARARLRDGEVICPECTGPEYSRLC